jgi:hypothetical protein
VILLSWALAVAAVVLAVTGVLKVVDPTSTGPVLQALGLPSGHLAARSVGVIELAVAFAALLTTGPLGAWLVAAVYGVFTVGLIVVRRRSPATSCGCVGRWSGPPQRRHLAINMAAAGVAAGAAVGAVSVSATLYNRVKFWGENNSTRLTRVRLAA